MSDREFGCDYCEDGAARALLIRCRGCGSLTCPNCRVSEDEARTGDDDCDHWSVPSMSRLAKFRPDPPET